MTLDEAKAALTAVDAEYQQAKAAWAAATEALREVKERRADALRAVRDADRMAEKPIGLREIARRRAEARRAAAVALRASGKTYREIGEAFGVSAELARGLVMRGEREARLAQIVAET